MCCPVSSLHAPGLASPQCRNIVWEPKIPGPIGLNSYSKGPTSLFLVSMAARIYAMKENKKMSWVWNISWIHNLVISALPAQGPGSSPAQGTWGGLVVDIPSKLFTRHQGLNCPVGPCSHTGMQTAGYRCFVNFACLWYIYIYIFDPKLHKYSRTLQNWRFTWALRLTILLFLAMLLIGIFVLW